MTKRTFTMPAQAPVKNVAESTLKRGDDDDKGEKLPWWCPFCRSGLTKEAAGYVDTFKVEL